MAFERAGWGVTDYAGVPSHNIFPTAFPAHCVGLIMGVDFGAAGDLCANPGPLPAPPRLLRLGLSCRCAADELPIVPSTVPAAPTEPATASLFLICRVTLHVSGYAGSGLPKSWAGSPPDAAGDRMYFDLRERRTVFSMTVRFVRQASCARRQVSGVPASAGFQKRNGLSSIQNLGPSSIRLPMTSTDSCRWCGPTLFISTSHALLAWFEDQHPSPSSAFHPGKSRSCRTGELHRNTKGILQRDRPVRVITTSDAREHSEILLYPQQPIPDRP